MGTSYNADRLNQACAWLVSLEGPGAYHLGRSCRCCYQPLSLNEKVTFKDG